MGCFYNECYSRCLTQGPQRPAPSKPELELIRIPVAFHLMGFAMLVGDDNDVITTEITCDQIRGDIIGEVNRIWMQARIQFDVLYCEEWDGMAPDDEQTESIRIIEASTKSGVSDDDNVTEAIGNLTWRMDESPKFYGAINIFVMPTMGGFVYGLTWPFKKEYVITMSQTSLGDWENLPLVTTRDDRYSFSQILAHELGHCFDFPGHHSPPCDGCLMGDDRTARGYILKPGDITRSRAYSSTLLSLLDESKTESKTKRGSSRDIFGLEAGKVIIN